MGRKVKLAAGIATAIVVVGGAGVVRAATSDDVPLEGNDFDRATTSALQHVGGGVVVETEVGDDDGSAYEVEVRLDDGSQVSVELDESFRVIGSDPDDDGPNDGDGGETDG